MGTRLRSPKSIAAIAAIVYLISVFLSCPDKHVPFVKNRLRANKCLKILQVFSFPETTETSPPLSFALKMFIFKKKNKPEPKNQK